MRGGSCAPSPGRRCELCCLKVGVAWQNIVRRRRSDI